MSLTDADLLRRRSSSHLPLDGVDFILYSYNEYSFEEQSFQSVYELLNLLKTDIENEDKPKDKYHWIEVINRSSTDLPSHIQLLCEHFHIHPLTIEDIGTLAPCMKLDLFNETGALYLLMKILTWNGQCVQQQQISFYLHCSQNLLITFQEKSMDDSEPFFQTIRNRLRKQHQQQQNTDEHVQQYQNTRLRQLNVDYLFYCLLDDIIGRYIFVMEEIADCIGNFDDYLMTDRRSRTLTILHSIYRLKHDLLHLRILFNPLKEIISRLQRETCDDQHVPFPRTDPSIRLGMKHFVIRRKAKSVRQTNNNDQQIMEVYSIYFNDYVYVYLNDLNNHIDQLIDSLEIQRESVSILISFWITLNSNETQEILNFLMLITVLFMPCTLLTGMNSTNFHIQPQYHYYYGYYIILALLAFILSGMVVWYKAKKWI